MNCPKCNSNMVKLESKKAKQPFIIGFILALGGLGTMFLGIIGLVAGAILGAIIGAIVQALAPARYDTIGTCQSCGNNWKIKNK